MFHTPYTETPAKIIESGIINNYFLSIPPEKLKSKIGVNSSNVYGITLTDNFQLLFCPADTYDPEPNDGYAFPVSSKTQRRWFSVIYGQVAFIHFITILDGKGERFKAQPIYGGPETEVLKYFVGKDELELNNSIMIESEKTVGVSFNPEEDVLLLCFNHDNNNPMGNMNYYKNTHDKFKQTLSVEDIAQVKNQMRHTIRNASALSNLGYTSI